MRTRVGKVRNNDPFRDRVDLAKQKDGGIARPTFPLYAWGEKRGVEAVRTVREVLSDVKRSREDFAGHLAKLEADGQGNSNLAWRFRDYITAAEKVIAAAPPSDRP